MHCSNAPFQKLPISNLIAERDLFIWWNSSSETPSAMEGTFFHGATTCMRRMYCRVVLGYFQTGALHNRGQVTPCQRLPGMPTSTEAWM
ncbi:unnamed protein product [Ascophyllum nodosum]